MSDRAPRPHIYWHGSPCSCSWSADHGNGTADGPEFAQPSRPDALEAADALAHAVRDMVTHDFSAGAVINVENARKRYEALRAQSAPPLRPREG